MSKLLKVIQNQGENAGITAKMYLKSHDLVKNTQFILLSLPQILGIISVSFSGILLLDIIALLSSSIALAYYIYYGKNQELYKTWGEKYMNLYHEIETYYKMNDTYTEAQVDIFKNQIAKLNAEKKPEYHVLVKKWVDRSMNNEFTYANEESPWYKGIINGSLNGKNPGS